MLKLKTNDDLKVMWNIFYRYSTKSPIEVNASIARSTGDILKILQCPKPSVCNNCNVKFMVTLMIIYVIFILILIYVTIIFYCCYIPEIHIQKNSLMVTAKHLQSHRNVDMEMNLRAKF